jgi:protein-S-isoprenylcysteine O-methyltransferase Ste14
MDESGLRSRLDALETRVSLVLALVVLGYVVVALAVLIRETAVVTPWTAGVGAVILLVVAGAVGLSRRRRARRWEVAS